MRARAKNILITTVLIAALFGMITAGLLILNPQKASQLTANFIEQITAKAAAPAHYSLPPASDTALASNPDAAFLKSFSKVFANIAKETRPSLVLIVAEKKAAMTQPNFPDDFFFPFLPPQFRGPGGFGGPSGPGGRKQNPSVETDGGSGFIVDVKNGYVITNNHVIENADKITITTYDNRKYTAKLVGAAKSVDVAVLKLVDFKPSSQLKQVSLGDSSQVEVGDWAIALGAPFELPQTLTMGVVSAIQRPGDTLGIVSPNSFIQTDASINPGNSGGPLVNIYGQVIGMNTAIYSRNGTSVGIGFAIPSSTIRLAADSIINKGKFIQAYLGVEMYPLDKFSADALKDLKVSSNTQGGLVMKIIPNSPASKADLRPYDIIQDVNGVPTQSPSDIQQQITFLKPGTEIKLGVLRNNQHITLRATVAELPAKLGDSDDNSSSDSQTDRQAGTLAQKYGLSLSSKKTPSGSGVLIAEVQQGSVADMATLKAGDVILKVNNKDVSSPKDFETILKASDKDKSSVLFLLVERDGAQSTIILQVN